MTRRDDVEVPDLRIYYLFLYDIIFSEFTIHKNQNDVREILFHD